MNPPSIDVVVPTYGRASLLLRCLEALAGQERLPDRMIVVVRTTDRETLELLAKEGSRLPNLTTVTVDVTGSLAALAAGVAASDADIIAFTDDDAAPHRDWVARVIDHFADPAVGGVGGVDVQPGVGRPSDVEVGRFRRTGRLVGNHHLGRGETRDVDVLKGVNMAFRRDALALPKSGLLRGQGALVDSEILVCGWARRQGWRLVYDPALIVDHYPAPRLGPDQRDRPRPSAVYDAAYNSVVASTAFAGSAGVVRALHRLVVGGSARPGVLRAFAAVVRGESEIVRRFPSSLAGSLVAALVCAARSAGRSRALVDTAAELHEVRSGPLSSTT